MKKILLSLICLFLFGASIAAQQGKLKVAVVFNTDTKFSILNPLTTNSLDINLRSSLYKQIEILNDTASFQLKELVLPEDMSGANDPSFSGIPRVSQLESWMKNVQKKEHFDLLLMVYKPVQMTGPYASLEGLSYGYNSSKEIVFSLNNALVFNVKNMKILAATTIDSESDYIAGTFAMDKNLPTSNMKNIETPIEMINKLHQEFALKVFQSLQVAKKKLLEK